MIPMPHPPYSSNLTLSDFFFLLVSPDEKSPQGKHFADVEEAKQKTAKALKGIKINEFKNYFKQWKKKVLIGVLYQMESTLKATEV